MLIAQGLTMLFFALGFVGYYSRFWRWLSQTKTAKSGINRILRLTAPAAAIVIAVLFDRMASGRLLPVGGLVQHGMSLFVVTFIILDADIWPSELLFRVAGMMTVWGLSHAGLGWGPLGVLSAVLAVAWAVATWYLGPKIRYHILPHFVWLMSIAVLYWVTIPSATAGFIMTPKLVVQANLLYAFAVIATAVYLTQMRQEERQSATNARRATYDALTNAKTYAIFQHDIEQQFIDAQRDGYPLTVVAIDVDHFKQVNDHYGHLAGNEILISVAATLQDELDHHPGRHQLYRTGGEEFSIIFGHTTAPAATATVRNCWAAVKHSTYHARQYALQVTISGGITTARPEDTHVDALLRRADDNLYQSKQHGRDTLTVEGTTLHDTARVQPQQLYAYCTQQVCSVATGHDDIATEVLAARYLAAKDQWQLSDTARPFEQQRDFVEQVAQDMGKVALTLHLTIGDCQARRTRERLAVFLAAGKRPARLRIVLDAPVTLTELAALRADYRQLAVGFVLAFPDDGDDMMVESLLPLLDGVRIPLTLLRTAGQSVQTSKRVMAFLHQCQQHHVITVADGIDNSVDGEYVRQTWPVDGGRGYFMHHPDLPRID